MRTYHLWSTVCWRDARTLTTPLPKGPLSRRMALAIKFDMITNALSELNQRQYRFCTEYVFDQHFSNAARCYFLTLLFVLIGSLNGTAFADKAVDADGRGSAVSHRIVRPLPPLRKRAMGKGAAYFVSKKGSDTNSGSLESPWATISHAMSELKASLRNPN